MTGKTTTLTTLAMLATMTGAAYATEAGYECSGGTRLTAVFSEPGATPGSVVLHLAGQSGDITLPQAMSADGGRYADGATEFWIKGKDASFTHAGKTETCHTK
ncbi:MliC family protein [Mesorhizobium sp. ASY16-5R]|uniref:MliC family protein n=1 Tax=Mesorhizobium sp. ASY16-5R TaxID=3445772 RepID=UPI003F9FD747